MNDQTPTPVTTSAPGDPPSVRLIDSLEDAEILLQHAARTGIEVDPAITKNIIEMRSAILAQSIDGVLEARFWESLTKLSKALQPATVEGIKETRQFRGSLFKAWLAERFGWLWGRDKAPAIEHPPEAYVAVINYTALAMLILVAVVMVQGLSGYGTMLLNNLTILQDQRIEREGERVEAVKLPATDQTRQSRMDAAAAKLSDVRAQETASIKLLGIFNYLSAGWLGLVPERVYAGDDRILIVEHARLTIVALKGYLMPLLIGTLGAIAHILRTLAVQIRDDSYSSEGRVQLRLRFVLGPLAGAAVGLIFVQDPQAVASSEVDAAAQLGLSVGPFALPFVAGYSVEFFFALADRIIGAVSSPPQQESK